LAQPAAQPPLFTGGDGGLSYRWRRRRQGNEMSPDTEEGSNIRLLTARELRRAVGLPSTTIHYYLRRGLLPRPQKTSASRSLYTDAHVRILRRINELKEQGLSLDEIQVQVGDLVEEANQNRIDLVSLEQRRLRRRILAVASREFTSKGYTNAHITTIIRKLAITPALLYSYFSSKRRLLIECAMALMKAGRTYVEPKQAQTDDPAKRVLWSVFGHTNVFRLGSVALALMRLEGANTDKELSRPLQEEYDKIIELLMSELQATKGGRPAAVPDELLAHSLLGALEQTVFRSQRDSKYKPEDLYRTHLWLFLAVRAALRGEVDIDSQLAEYEGFISELSTTPAPPQLSEEA